MQATVPHNMPVLQSGCTQPYVYVEASVYGSPWPGTAALAHELSTWLKTRSIKITGPLFYRYWAICYAPECLKLEVGYPVSAAAEGNGHIRPGILPGGTFATLVHCGHPDMLPRSMEVLQCWANGQGLKWKKCQQDQQEVWAGRFDFFLTDPANEPDPNKWRTAIAFLIDEQS